MISSPASSGSSASVRLRCARPPPKSLTKSSEKWLSTASKAASRRPVEGRDPLAQARDRGHQVASLGLHAGDPQIQLFGFRLGAQIDRAHILALTLEPRQLEFGVLACRQLFVGTDIGARKDFVRPAFERLADARDQCLQAFACMFQGSFAAHSVLAGRLRKGLGLLQGARQLGLPGLALGKSIGRRLAAGFGLIQKLRQGQALGLDLPW
jgi:hypothetical protein